MATTLGFVRGAVGWLDNPYFWQGTRFVLDRAFGLYRRRVRLMEAWGVLAGAPSALDVGCGTGQYAAATAGPYLGIDHNERYIAFARRKRGGGNKEFRCL